MIQNAIYFRFSLPLRCSATRESVRVDKANAAIRRGA